MLKMRVSHLVKATYMQIELLCITIDTKVQTKAELGLSI